MSVNEGVGEAPCRIAITTADNSGGLGSVIQAQAEKAAPLLAWAEPDPTQVVFKSRTGRREDFQPFVRGMPAWPADLRLVEARLFWDKAALHAVAAGDGNCRWMRVEERDDGEIEAVRSAFPVHALRDRQRFGLQGNGENLTAVEYWRGGRIICWRLLPENA